MTVEGLDGAARTTNIVVTRAGISGSPLLSREQASFYSERCYLAQATLGRLLEIYEDKDTRKSDSPLTKFVKDLLGLDHLDALIEGLYEAGDVRRLRSTLPPIGMFARISQHLRTISAPDKTEQRTTRRRDTRPSMIDC